MKIKEREVRMNNRRFLEWEDPLEESTNMMGTMDRWELAETTAYHEAGHAVAMYLLGRRFSKISILPDEDSEGRVTLPDSYWEPFGPDSIYAGATKDRILTEVMIGLAGQVAVYNLTARQDYARMGSVDDLWGADLLARWVCSSHGETDAYLDRLRIRTRNLLLRRAHWAAVEALAKALLEQEEMGYRKASEIISDAIKGQSRNEGAKLQTTSN
jgi:hypothetical protein